MAFGSVYAISQMTLVAVAIFLIPWFLHKRRKILQKKVFIDKYGSLVLAMKTKEFYPKIHLSCFLLRRVVLAALIVYFDDYPYAQIYV